MNAIEIRRVGRDDRALFERVAAEVFDAPVDAKRLSAYLDAPGHYMILALSGGEVVGQVAAVVHRHPDKPTELYIDEVGVADGFRRRGVARGMMEAMLAWGRELGCEEWWVGTESENTAARGLYTKFAAEPEDFVMFVEEL